MTTDDRDGGPLSSITDRVKTSLGGGSSSEDPYRDTDLAAQARGEGSDVEGAEPDVGMFRAEGDSSVDSNRVDRAVAGGARVGDDQGGMLGPGGGASLDSGDDDPPSGRGADLGTEYGASAEYSGASTEPSLGMGDAGAVGEAPTEDLNLEEHSGI